MIAQIQIRRGTTAEWAAADAVVLAVGEPGYDTTLKRLKMGDGVTAWASLPWSDSGVCTMANAKSPPGGLTAAVGDGSADDTNALQDIIDHLDALGGGTLYLPIGTYKITASLTTVHTNIIGESSQPTSWSVIKAVACHGITISPEWGVVVRDVAIHLDGYTKSYTGILCNGTGAAPNAVNYCTFSNLDLRGWGVGVDLKYTWNATLDAVNTMYCTVGVRLFGQSVNNVITNSYLVTDGLSGSASISTVSDGGLNGEGLMVSNCLLASGQYGIISSSFLSLNVVNCIIDLIKSVGIHLTGVKGFCLSNSWCYATGDVIFSADLGVYEDQFCRVIGNTLTSVSGTSGIFIGDRNKNWIIANNYISAANISIYLEFGASGCVVTGNQILSSYAQAILVVGNNNVIANNTGPGKVAVNSQDDRNILFNNMAMPIMINGLYTAAPVGGTWKLGDIVYNATPASAGNIGWVCTVAGTPGTWKAFGVIS